MKWYQKLLYTLGLLLMGYGAGVGAGRAFTCEYLWAFLLIPGLIMYWASKPYKF